MKISNKFDYRINIFHFLFITFVVNQTLNIPFIKRDLDKNTCDNNMKKILNIFSILDETTQNQFNKFFIFDFFFNENFNYNKIEDESEIIMNYKKSKINFYNNLEKDLSNPHIKDRFSLFSKCKSRSIFFENSCSEKTLEYIYKQIKYIQIQHGEYCSSLYEEILCNIYCGKESNKNILLYEEDVYNDKETFYITMNTCKNFLSKCPKIKIFGEENFNETNNEFFVFRKNITYNYNNETSDKHKISEEDYTEKINFHNIFRYKKKFQKNRVNLINDKKENIKIWNSIYTDICLKEIPIIGQFKNKFKLKISDYQDEFKGLDLFDLDCKIESIKYDSGYIFDEIKNYNQVLNETSRKAEFFEEKIKGLYSTIDLQIKNRTINNFVKHNLKSNLIKNKKKLREGKIINDTFRVIEKNLEKLDDNGLDEVHTNDNKKFIQNIFLNSSKINLDYYIYDLNYEFILKEFMLAINKNYIEIFGEEPIFNIENLNDETYRNAKKEFSLILKNNFELVLKRIEKNFRDFKISNPTFFPNIDNSLLENKVQILKNIQEYYIFIVDYIIFVEPFTLPTNLSSDDLIKKRLMLFNHLQGIFYKFFKENFLRYYNQYSLNTNDFDPLIVSI